MRFNASKMFALSVLDRIIDVSIEAESGRIDLNKADDELITALLISHGVSEKAADSFLAKLRDWQDDDDVRRPGGAEVADYHQAGLSYRPRNAPLASIDEVFQLLEVDRGTLTCMLPAFTVYSGGSHVDARYAGPLVRQALEWAERHDWGNQQSAPSSEALSSNATVDNSSYAGQVVRLHLSDPASHQSAMVHDVVVRLTGDGREPALIYAIENRANIAGDSRNCPATLK
jgi:general secretion pathway protein K